jgi:hypothetical protein
MVLDSLLSSNSKAFYDAISRWSHIFPSVFDVENILVRLQKKMKETNSFFASEGGGVAAVIPREGMRKVDVWLQESEGHMLIMLRQYSKALHSYLSLASFLRRTRYQKMIYILSAETPSAALGDINPALYGTSPSSGTIYSVDGAIQSNAFVSGDGLDIDEDNGSSGLQEYLESVFEIEDEGLVDVYESRIQQLSALLASPAAASAGGGASIGVGFISAYESTISPVTSRDGNSTGESDDLVSRFMRYFLNPLFHVACLRSCIF